MLMSTRASRRRRPACKPAPCTFRLLPLSLLPQLLLLLQSRGIRASYPSLCATHGAVRVCSAAATPAAAATPVAEPTFAVPVTPTEPVALNLSFTTPAVPGTPQPETPTGPGDTLTPRRSTRLSRAVSETPVSATPKADPVDVTRRSERGKVRIPSWALRLCAARLTERSVDARSARNTARPARGAWTPRTCSCLKTSWTSWRLPLQRPPCPRSRCAHTAIEARVRVCALTEPPVQQLGRRIVRAPTKGRIRRGGPSAATPSAVRGRLLSAGPSTMHGEHVGRGGRPGRAERVTAAFAGRAASAQYQHAQQQPQAASKPVAAAPVVPVDLQPLSRLFRQLGLVSVRMCACAGMVFMCARQGYHHLCVFNCAEAVEVLNALPNEQLETGWVLSQLGRCYFEMVNYQRSVSYYQRSRKVRTISPAARPARPHLARVRRSTRTGWRAWSTSPPRCGTSSRRCGCAG
jgi:hypothetical protein